VPAESADASGEGGSLAMSTRTHSGPGRWNFDAVGFLARTEDRFSRPRKYETTVNSREAVEREEGREE
jgi:hypothetical protein